MDNKIIRPGYVVEIIGTNYNGQIGYVMTTDFHVATVELKDKTTHVLLKENLKVINSNTEIDPEEPEKLKEIKEKYVREYIGYPGNYMRSWTEEDIRKVIDRYQGEDLSRKNKKKLELIDYTIALELQRTVGGVQWLRRRLFKKSHAKVSLTDLIKKLKDEFGLI